MNDAKSSSAPRGRRWLRIFGIIVAVLIVLLVAAWFTVTSSAFVKGVILPRVAKAMNAQISVSDISVSPFSQIDLKNLKVQTTGTEPLLEAKEVRAQYHLFAILGGNLAIDDVTLDTPTINLVVNPDGTSNLDPLTQSSAPKTAATNAVTAAKPAPSKPLQIDLKKLTLSNATFRQTQNFKDGTHNLTELLDVNVTLTNLKNGTTGKLQLGALASMDNQSPAVATLKTKIDGHFDFTPAADFKSASVKGQATFDVTQAAGTMKDFADFGGELDCDVTPTAINQLALRFHHANEQLGELQANGPFNTATTEGKLNVEILSLDRRVLNFFGASSGLDFGGTTINSTNQIELTKHGAAISASGNLAVNNLQIIRAGQRTPTLNAEANYDVAIDRTAQSAVLRAVNLSATQNGKPLARAALSQPMNLSWNSAGQNVGDSTFNVSVTGLNLVDWKPFLGDSVAGGNFSFDTKLLAHSGGKQIDFNLNSQIANLDASFGSNAVRQADLTVAASGSVSEFKQYKLDNFRVQLAQQSQPALTVSGSGTAEPAAQLADLTVQLQTSLPALLKLLPQPGAEFTSGNVDATAKISQKGDAQTVTGNLSVASLTGKFGNDSFENYSVSSDYHVTKNGAQLQNVRAGGKLTNNGKAGGNFDVALNYDDRKNLNVTAKLDGLNENGLRPFLESALGDKKLVSVSLNANTTVQLDPQNNVSAKGNLQVANLVVNDPTGQIPATPLAAKFDLDVTEKDKLAQLNQVKITLTPTAQAKNELQLSGSVDLAKTNAIAGNLKLVADSLDVTPYYDLFAGKPNAAPAKAPAETQSSPAPAPSSNPNQEPDAKQLPFGTFTVDASIGKFYLHQVQASDIATTVKIDGSHVVVDPCKLTLNGAPVTASVDLNLGVPGYQYSVIFNANRVPIAPLVDTFSPDNKGRMKGDLLADVNVQGAGVTGKNLKKTLTGHVDIVLTNALIQIASQNNAPKQKPRNFLGFLGHQFGNLLSGTVIVIADALKLNEIQNSPITGVHLHTTMGNGKITGTDVGAGSDAFQAQTAGTITLANVLTNSTIDNWPVHLALSKGPAQRLGFVPANAQPNQQFFSIPDFVALNGTVGTPGSKIDKVQLAVILGRSGVNVYNDVRKGNITTNAIDAIGNLLNNKTAGKVLKLFK